MARRRTIQKVFVRNWVDIGGNEWIWQDCLGWPFIRRNKIWKNSKHKTLGTQIESRRCSTTTESMTWFCSSKTRMQKIARRTCDKDSTGMQNHSSWSTNKEDSEEDKHSKESTRMTIESILEPVDVSTIQSHRETCRFRPRQQIGTVTIGRREVGIIGILHGLKIRVFIRV